jgi:nicotinamidase-related amidase
MKGVQPVEKQALLIIDMVRDYFRPEANYPITPLAWEIVEPINALIREFRKRGLPVIFSTDSFNENDFIFTGRMHPHSLSGTPGAELLDALDRQETDLWLPKPRFSAFFGTGLETSLRAQGVTLCAVAGIATNFCVLTTAMDALCHDFKAVLLEDCSAAFSREIHGNTLDLYRRNPLYPLLRVMNSEDLVRELP